MYKLSNPFRASTAANDALAGQALRHSLPDLAGRGRSVVLDHGWPLSASAWKLQVAALRNAGYRMETYGRTDTPEPGCSRGLLADDMQSMLDRCGLEDVTLVGYAMGGAEVAHYIGRYGASGLHAWCSPRLHV